MLSQKKKPFMSKKLRTVLLNKTSVMQAILTQSAAQERKNYEPNIDKIFDRFPPTKKVTSSIWVSSRKACLANPEALS